MPTPTEGSPLLQLVARVLLAALFLWSGIGKVVAFGAVSGMLAARGFPLPPVLTTLAAVLELVGAILLLAGWKVRPASYALAAFALLTAVLFHAEFADRNQTIHFLKNLAIAGGLLQLAAAGPGRLSLARGPA